jgi:patatin-related protein
VERSRETRLGIVMYGGVSLAVYENGVAQELFRAVRSDAPIGDLRSATPTIYRLVKAIADTEIFVDIVSGTSAGGINGVMLAYALANAKDFTQAASLWLEKGDFLALLRKPDEEDVSSVLDSRGYYHKSLTQAFQMIDDHPFGERYESEIDLFVTGTDVHGRVFTEFDDQGNPIDVKEHRSVFMLSYRPERKNEFDRKDIDALAKLCRLTSCFPVAFEPVHVCDPGARPADWSDQDVATDETLRRWGKLTHDAFFLDGGLLDNKPFSYTVNAIFGRLAERDVDRLLLYVEPDPEHFDDKRLKETPNVVKAASDALIAIPGYESIAGDLQAIAERNTKLARYADTTEQLKAETAGEDRLGQNFDEAAILGSKKDPRVRIYINARLAQLRDRALLGILKVNGEMQLLSGESRHAAKVLVDSFEDWPGEGLDTLGEFDVLYRLRRLYHVVYSIKSRIYDENRPEPERIVHYQDVWRRLNHQIKVLEMIRFVLESVIDNSKIQFKDLAVKKPNAALASGKWQLVRNLLAAALAPSPRLGTAGVRDWGTTVDPQRREEERTDRDDLMADLKSRIRALFEKDGSDLAPPVGNLLLNTDQQERQILTLLFPGDPIRIAYCNFIVLDSYLFPLEQMGKIDAKDPIRTVRVSPIDSRFGFGKNMSVGEKLCGRSLGHFGGFLKRSWRANDLMWGRLDALCQIVQCIVTPERLDKLKARGYDASLWLGEFDLQKLFPNSSTEMVQQIEMDLRNLHVYAGEHVRETRPAETPSRFEQFQERFVRAAQSELLETEIPRVMQMAIDQQVLWNQYNLSSRPNPFRAADQRWTTGVRQIDSAVLSLAHDKLAQLKAKPEPGNWTRFFESGDYAIAAESPGSGIPKPVLLEMATRSVLVLQNCMAGVLGAKTADKMKSNAFFRFGVGYPLRATYGFAMFQRTAPEFARSASVAAFLVPALMLVVAIVWRQPLLYSSDSGKTELHWVAIQWLALLPILILLAQVFLYGLVRRLTIALLVPLFGLLVTLGLIKANMVHWQEGGGWAGDILSFLTAHSTAVWVGVGTAMIVAIPFRALRPELEIYLRALGAEFRSWIQDRRIERRKRRSAAAQSLPRTIAPDQPGSTH